MPRLLYPTNSLAHLGTTMSCNTSTICLTNRRFKVHATTAGFNRGSLVRNMGCTRRRNMGMRIAYGAVPRGSRVPHLPSFLEFLGGVNISTVVSTSLNAVVVIGGCTPSISLRVSMRSNVYGCRATGRFCGLNTGHVILTHRLALGRVGRVQRGAPGSLRVRVFTRNTVYISCSSHYLLSDCVANESTGHNSYTRPYH